MNKQDSRFIASDIKIKEAFYEILSRKSIDEIRTQEIIAAAGINKSTFYSHYRDKYDLLESISKDAVDMLFPALESIFSVILDEEIIQNNLDASYVLFADIFQKNKDFFRIVMRNTSGSTLASGISDLIEKIWAEKSIADPGVVYYSYLINAITYIIVGTAEKWVKRDCIDPSDDLIRLAQDVGVGVQKALIRKQ